MLDFTIFFNKDVSIYLFIFARNKGIELRLQGIQQMLKIVDFTSIMCI